MIRINDVRLSRFQMERLDPTWRTATYAASRVDGFALEIFVDGVVGIGGTAAHPNTIASNDLAVQLNGPVRETLVGADPIRGNLIRQRLRSLKVHPRARLAADLALYDLLGKIANLPFHAFWGGAVQSKIKVVRMVGIKPPNELKNAVRALLAQGVTHFKVKIGTGIEEDVERIRVLRESFGADIWISVDGNSAYTPELALALSRALYQYDVSLIEQPVDDEDLMGMARLAEASPIPIMADQCVKDEQSALTVCRMGAAHIVSIKATSMGSLDQCREVYEICRAFGIRVHFGGSVTSAIADVAQAQMAASLLGVDEECEVGEFMAVQGEPITGVKIRDGCLEIGAEPGWGLALVPVSRSVDVQTDKTVGG